MADRLWRLGSPARRTAYVENARESPFLANESVSAGLIFDLPNIACGMLFSVNMWADEFSAPNLVKAVPALPMHQRLRTAAGRRRYPPGRAAAGSSPNSNADG